MSLIKKIGIPLLCVLLYSCNEKSDAISKGEFLLDISIIDLADNTKVVLKKQENNTTVSVDSGYTKNGTIQFRGSIESPSLFGIFYTGT